jgi:DNA-binding XRE family transcriptional regulator
MTPEEVPQELIAILDRAAGRQHSRTGPAVACLAEILTATQPVIIREPGDLAGRLYAGRTAQGLSQMRFAYAHGFDQRQICDWERGRFEPKLSSAIRIAEALGYDLALVPREERA